MNAISKKDGEEKKSTFPRSNALSNALDFDLHRQLRVLWAQRDVIFLCVAGVFILTWALMSTMTPQYRATAEVMMENHNQRGIDLKNFMNQLQPNQIQVLSQVEVIKSRSLAERVVDRLKLMEDPEFNSSLRPPPKFSIAKLLAPVDRIFSHSAPAPDISAEDKAARARARVVGQLLSGLDVKPVQQSLVITLTYRSPNPKKAAEIVNAFADGFVLDQIEARFELTKQLTDWLNGRLEGLRQQVSDSERAVESYRSNNGLFENKGLLGVQQQLTELNSQLITAQANRATVEAKVAHIESLQNSDEAELLDSPLIQKLKEQEEQQAREISEISIRYGEKHPTMIKALAAQQELRNKIKFEVDRLIQVERGELTIARSRESALRDQIRRLEETVQSKNQLGIRLHDLEREAQSNRAIYETFLTRSKESSQEEDIRQAEARVISRAETPEAPSSPNRSLMTTSALVGGLLLGAIVVFLREHLNRTVRSPEQLEAITGVPSLGMIQMLKAGGKDKDSSRHSYLVDHPHSAFAESFRGLWVSLKHAERNSIPRVVVVTSSLPGEGKSFTSLSLARTVAGMGGRVALVDCDLRRPTLAKVTGVKPEHYFDEALSGDLPISDVIVRDNLTELDIVASRALKRPPMDLLNSPRMSAIIDELRDSYDLVVIDTPPTMAVSDVQIIGQKADKVLFAVRWEKTPKEVVLTVLRALRDVKIEVAGTLLTQVNLKRHAQYGYGDAGYYYGKYKSYYNE